MTNLPYPIRPMALLAENFRGLCGGYRLNLERDLTVLIGDNGAGKSSLLIAMEWCLFGAEATTKSGSEIEERGNWTLANASAAGETRVVLELKLKEGRARLIRRRPADAAARDEDHVLLELPGHEVLQGAEVRDWLAWNQLPDWKSWKRSFCQHQELSRARVTDDSGRSAAIAGMLGLEEYRKVNDDLKKVKVKRLEQRAVEELAHLAAEQQRSLERPGLEGQRRCWSGRVPRRLARAAEAMAGRPVGRPLPGSAEPPRAARRALRRRSSRARGAADGAVLTVLSRSVMW